MTLLIYNENLSLPVDWSVRAEDFCGRKRFEETLQAKPRRLHKRPAESERLERKSGSLTKHKLVPRQSKK
jgi:hypothetical protein